MVGVHGRPGLSGGESGAPAVGDWLLTTDRRRDCYGGARVRFIPYHLVAMYQYHEE